MTQDMNTIYGQDICNYGAGALQNCDGGFGGRKAVAVLRKDFSRFLRFAAVLLLMVVGVSGVKAQDETDYSGMYYIANNNTPNKNSPTVTDYKGYGNVSNYYLSPSEEYYDKTNNSVVTELNNMPFLTTLQTQQGDNSLWVVEKITVNNNIYYTFHINGTNNYITVNDALTGYSKNHRKRVHLEELTPTKLTDRNYFIINPLDESKNIDGVRGFNICCLDTYKSGNNKYLNPAGGNKTSTTSVNNNETPWSGGMVGFYVNNDGTGSDWYFEVPKPTIRFNSDNKIEITYVDDPATIYYTTNGDEPPTSGTEHIYNEPFDPDNDVTTIKAYAVVNGKVSALATYEPPFLLGPTHQYIIQSKQCQFYNLIPNTSIDTKYVSTLNVPCETMAWHFEYAEEGYYYVVDNSGWYLYYTTTDNSNKYLYLKSSKDDSDGYKFSITAHTSGGFNIIPKGQTMPVCKANYGGGNTGLTPAKLAGKTSDATSRWDIIPYNAANLPQWADAPFDNVSDDDHTYYYQIVSVSQSTMPIILNNDGAVKSQTIPDGIDERKTIWVIKKVADDGDDLLDFYTFENAYTGQKLYYNGIGRNKTTNAFQLGLPSVEGANEQWSHFVIVQTETGYNIIPRPIVDNTKAINTSSNNEAFNCINRAQGRDILGTYYDDGNGSRWTFSQVDFCMPLEFTESEGNITLTCATKGAEIHYTTDGTTPDGTTANVVSESTSWASSGQHRIKAIAVVKSGETVTASSAVVTLLNKPDVTLAAGPYTYKDAAWEPAVTKVSIGESGSETDAEIDPATYTVTYSDDRTNVGTVTVTLEDKVEGDMYVWNASTTFDITQKPVTITADSDTKVYNGTALTKSTATATGLVEGHSLASVTVTGTQTVVGESNNVPSAAVIKKGETDVTANYNITYTNGTLTVTAKAVTITAKDAEKEYDGTPLTESGFTTTALETGDTHTFTVVMTEGSTITNVGTQDNEIATVDGIAVTTGTETTVGNYKVTTAKGTLTVTKKTLTITADSDEKVYDGTPLTKNSYTNTDLLSGDVLESVTVTGTRTDAGESDNVPSAAVIKNANSEVITNSYNVVYKNGKLKVTAKPVTITADSGEKEYDGTALTKNTYTHTALVEGHTITSVTITGSQTNVGTGNNVPSAAVIKKGDDVMTANYNITYTNGTLKITPAAATVTADAKTKVYGDAEPTYTATVTGLKNNETANVLTYTFSRATGENVGEYTITPAGEATQGNYTVTYATGKLTITKAAANVKADDKTKGYGDADPAFTATVTGLKNGDAASVLTYTFSRAEGENVNAGGYTITPAGNAEQGNYTVTYDTGTLTITSKAIGDGVNPAEGIDIDITYDGTNYTVTVKQGENTLLEGEDKAYTWTGAEEGTDTYVVTITGHGNYNNSAKATYIKLDFYDTTPDQAFDLETTAAVYYAAQNLKVNESFEAYYVTNLADNTLTITKVEAGEGENKKNYIPEGQPVLLISETNPAPKGFTLKPYTGTDLVTIPTTGEGANLLKVVTDDGGREVNLAEVYMFSMGEFVLTKAGRMSKGKFYLENPDYNTSAHSRSVLSITSGDVTGIHTSQLSDTDSQIPDIWYTIGGQKLHKKPTRKGIYLHNGKKVVIK